MNTLTEVKRQMSGTRIFKKNIVLVFWVDTLFNFNFKQWIRSKCQGHEVNPGITITALPSRRRRPITTQVRFSKT